MTTPGQGQIKLKRVLLKLSGEALCGVPGGFGLQPETLKAISAEIAEVHALGAEIGIVIGGGNIFRGLKGSASGMDRASADHMGMLATVINGIALQDALEKWNVPTRVMSALDIRQVSEPYIRRRAVRHLEKGRIVIFVAGTGNPYFSTDTAAVLRALEVEAEVILKGTNVEGIFTADPRKDPGAELIPELTFQEALVNGYEVMDRSAFGLCQTNQLPIVVFNMNQTGNLDRVLQGAAVGTIVQ